MIVVVDVVVVVNVVLVVVDDGSTVVLFSFSVEMRPVIVVLFSANDVPNISATLEFANFWFFTF